MLMISYCFMVFHFHSKKVSLAISKPKELWKIIVKAMIQDNPDHPVYLSNYTMCVYIYIYLYSYIYFLHYVYVRYILHLEGVHGESSRIFHKAPSFGNFWWQAKRCVCEAQVHSRKRLKTSFDQSFEAGKRRQEALKKQERLHRWREHDAWEN